MQTLSPELQQAVDSTVVAAWPELIAEFNHNIYTTGTVVTVPAGRPEDLFPPESVIDMKYVDSGLPKAIVGNAYCNAQTNDIQYRVVSEDDTYQYWVSPTPSVAESISDATVEVNYGTQRATNKVRAVFDVSDSAPTSVTIELFIDSEWTTVGSSLTPNAQGVIELYYNGASWGAAYNIDSLVDVSRMRVTVDAMANADKYAHFVNIAAYHVYDMTDRITSWTINRNQEEADPISPIGFGSVNTLNVELDNSDGLFDPENIDSELYNMLKRNTVLKTYAAYDTSAGVQKVELGTFYTESWSHNVPDVQAGVEATCLARPMQEAFIQPFYLENYRERDVARELLQRAGFGNIQYDIIDEEKIIPYLWHENEVAVWESLSELASATLSYLIRREDGSLLWQNIETQYEKPVDKTITADKDIENLAHEFSVITNKVTINYNIYGVPYDKWADEEVTQELWYGSEAEALVATPILEPVAIDADVIRLSTNDTDFALWPESGALAIQGERIRYNAKRKQSGFYELYELERGVLGTTPRAHTTSNTGTGSTSGGTVTARQLIIDGNLHLSAPTSATYNTYNYSLYGNGSSQHTVYGTRISFPAVRIDAVAGLTIHRSGNNGYHFMLSTTEHANRSSTHEIKVYRYDDGVRVPMGVKEGYAFEVDREAWYDFEVVANYTAATPSYSLYVNGGFVMSFVDGEYQTGTYGPYIKGRTTAEFNRFYVASPLSEPDLTGNRYHDPISYSTWSSDYWFAATGPNVEVNEFGPYARQVKEFEVDFTKVPARSSSLLSTNVWQARAFGYVAGPYSARFAMENITTRTAVINGESLVFDEPIEMSLLAYGVPLIVESEEKKELFDADSVRRYGSVEVDMSNPWIQTEAMANYVARFITQRFCTCQVDIVSVETITDPSVQVGDVLAVDYPERGYKAATHEYIVTGSNTDWNDGFYTTLELKRRREAVGS